MDVSSQQEQFILRLLLLYNYLNLKGSEEPLSQHLLLCNFSEQVRCPFYWMIVSGLTSEPLQIIHDILIQSIYLSPSDIWWKQSDT